MISKQIDNKLIKLKGTYTYKQLMKLLSSTFIAYEYNEGMNFLRQSIYRLKKSGIVFKEKDGSFTFNSGKVNIEIKKNSLKQLINSNLTSTSIGELLNKFGLIDQLPGQKYILIQKRHKPIKRDLLGTYKLLITQYEFNAKTKKYFEYAKIFENLSDTFTDRAAFYNLIEKEGEEVVRDTFRKISPYILNKYKKRYESYISWVTDRTNRW
ncbi:MAG: hypothetical protein HRT98_02835 [Mycoplasmatales bacterium]|nr:hypothetical protein [Mycoplasmatales bacterium]